MNTILTPAFTASDLVAFGVAVRRTSAFGYALSGAARRTPTIG